PVRAAPPRAAVVPHVPGSAVPGAAGDGGAAVGVRRVGLQRHQDAGVAAHRLALRPGAGVLLVPVARPHPGRGPGGTGRPARPAAGGDHSMSGPGPLFPWLERLTAVVLLLVVLALGWVIVVAYQPGWARLATVEAEVVLLLALLTVALVLVSVVAL